MLTQRPTEAHLSDDIGVLTPNATTPAYGPLTHLMGGGVVTCRED